MARVTEENLDACEFHPERFWSRGEAAMGIIAGIFIGGMIVGSMK